MQSLEASFAYLSQKYPITKVYQRESSYSKDNNNHINDEKTELPFCHNQTKPTYGLF